MSWWLFPPATREVQFDEKWSFVGKKEKHCEQVVPPRTGKPGRPKGPYHVPSPVLKYATVHKTRKKGRVVKIDFRVVFGTVAAVMTARPRRARGWSRSMSRVQVPTRSVTCLRPWRGWISATASFCCWGEGE